ncbi:MAG: hypothetical protein IPF96_15690 [Rhodobacter sp.]|nr:hypothetical protein [Rhodobacter sp.]
MAYLLLLGVPVTVFAALQLAGIPLRLRLEHRARAEWLLGIIGGLYGGVSGIWGPPLLVLLLSTGVPKLEMVRAQGVVFLIGAVALLSRAHLGTGWPAATGWSFRAVLWSCSAMAGMILGSRGRGRLTVRGSGAGQRVCW